MQLFERKQQQQKRMTKRRVELGAELCPKACLGGVTWMFERKLHGVTFFLSRNYVLYVHIVGDRLKPRNSVFPVLRKTQKNYFKNSVLIQTYQVSTYVCCYDFSWRKRVIMNDFC